MSRHRRDLKTAPASEVGQRAGAGKRMSGAAPTHGLDRASGSRCPMGGNASGRATSWQGREARRGSGLRIKLWITQLWITQLG
jgi:hypothetical protein